jgi:hypothetical protein
MSLRKGLGRPKCSGTSLRVVAAAISSRESIGKSRSVSLLPSKMASDRGKSSLELHLPLVAGILGALRCSPARCSRTGPEAILALSSCIKRALITGLPRTTPLAKPTPSIPTCVFVAKMYAEAGINASGDETQDNMTGVDVNRHSQVAHCLDCPSRRYEAGVIWRRRAKKRLRQPACSPCLAVASGN